MDVLSSVVVNGGDGADVINLSTAVNSIFFPGPVTSNGNNGNDMVNVGSSSGQSVSFGSLTITGGNDNDVISFASTLFVASPVVIQGNAGNDTYENVIGGSLGDTLTGNGLANVLAGGAGNDNLNGGTGKDILLGGIGVDTLTGGSGEDLMLGARYTSETNSAALIALRSEWTSASSYGDRVAHLLGTLAGGANGNSKLTSATVKEDNAKDTLKGNAGKDWYLRNCLGAIVANRDAVTDVDLDSVFTEISSWL